MSAVIPTCSRRTMLDYWPASARPLASLVFVAPLIVIYEGGNWWLGANTSRTAADLWLRGILETAGFGHYLLLPLLTIALLLAWHHARRDPWCIEARTIGRMVLEAAGWSAAIFVVASFTLVLSSRDVLSSRGTVQVLAAAPTQLAQQAFSSRALAYLGAGVYEELLFRLLAVPPVFLLLRASGFQRKASLLAAVVLTSVGFAAAHYQWNVHALGWHLAWTHGETFSAPSFFFRLTAGATFAGLFAYRGFGIAAVSHAFYNLLALLV